MSFLDLPGWMIWGIIAVVFLVLEMVTTVYVALGFAVGAAIAGLVAFMAPDLAVGWQALIWAGLGLAVWLALSRWSAGRRKSRPDINDFDSRDSLPASDRRRRSLPGKDDAP
ncbi:hypothetical protein HUK65_01240 [Rhodobacteraceae bacterium 2376]|uniref:NfeD-like partner-binding protein n=1 Tax=Rhabdonatronobacter sediminivivens TaxID=2743469 RepID=A0A7Z0KW82_9RHOB|nr:hypothetical protein [Rhabdonatronobacter sediminivivens]NYS23599.1 hypothetical protein [Rhabdonatronobacter sediminivivens]